MTAYPMRRYFWSFKKMFTMLKTNGKNSVTASGKTVLSPQLLNSNIHKHLLLQQVAPLCCVQATWHKRGSKDMGLWILVGADQWNTEIYLLPLAQIIAIQRAILTTLGLLLQANLWPAVATFGPVSNFHHFNSQKPGNKKGNLSFLIWSAIQEPSEFLRYYKVHMNTEIFSQKQCWLNLSVILWAHFKIIKIIINPNLT